MAVLVRTCCCGADLRTGVQLIGIFGLLVAGYAIYTDFQLSNTLKHGGYIVPYEYIEAVKKLSYTGIAFGVISLLANCSLLVSSCWSKRSLAYPWIIWNIFSLIYTFAVTMFFIAIWNGFSYVFIGNIFGWLLLIYFIIVVYSYIEILREDPSAFEPQLPSNVLTQMQSPPYERFA